MRTTTTNTGRAVSLLLAGAVSLSLLTASTGTAQAAEQVCTGTSSIYGILDDGRLTYSAITPGTGNRIRTRTGPDLGFEPKAMATLNFNTILVTSTAGALYRIDVQTNDETLAVSAIDKIVDKGWTHDKLSYDGYGHLYGTTADGTLLQYLVSQAKPKGVEHIGQRAEIGTGFVLKTLTTVGQDRLIATTEAGKLLSYKIIGGAWKRDDLKESGWSGFDQVVSSGSGFHYGRIATTGAMYWYKDANISDGNGDDITYHNDDPVDTSGWTQNLLSAAPGQVTCKSVSTLGQDIAKDARAEVGNDFNDYDFDYSRAWCAEFVKYIWAGNDVTGSSEVDARAISLREYGLKHDTYRTGSPKVGDAVLYDTDGSLTDGEADHVNIVVTVSSDGKQIETVGGNESHQVQKTGWFNWDTASSPIGAGPALAFISPKG
ncbi:MAG TPA: CHAP domain-containing protein [Streptomyces sp.]|uniref:CHAP domain-containing protein n=1 Tax=Streptomyces sp. TaxID=1931 RepID=UPI002C27C3A0|nr:CHAP domain-containing protein [Streptomyces sp.]HWU07070.1 CHAP domain-containing protein [Streptomyces sp.]